MSVTKFPDRRPQRPGRRQDGPASVYSIDQPPSSDFTWPPTKEQIDSCETIDLDPQEGRASEGFVVLVGHEAQPGSWRLRVVVSSPGPPKRWRKVRRSHGYLWPLAASLLVLELIHWRPVPTSSDQATPEPSAEIARSAQSDAAPVAPPASQRIESRRRTPAPSAAVARRTPPSTRRSAPATRPTAPGRQAEAVHTPDIEPLAPLFASTGAAATPNGGSAADNFTPPRVSMRAPSPRRPSPFPAARGSSTRVEVMVDARGQVESARLRSAGASYFDQQALEMVRTWRFEPARRGGRPVRSVVDVEIPSR